EHSLSYLSSASWKCSLVHHLFGISERKSGHFLSPVPSVSTPSRPRDLRFGRRLNELRSREPRLRACYSVRHEAYVPLTLSSCLVLSWLRPLIHTDRPETRAEPHRRLRGDWTCAHGETTRAAEAAGRRRRRGAPRPSPGPL